VALLVALLLAVAGTAAAEQPKGSKGKKGEKDKEVQATLAPSVISTVERDPTPEEVLTLEEERKQDLEIFIRRTRDFTDVVDGMIRRVYEMRKEFIDGSYQSKIDAEEALLLERLRDAIAYFEAFLVKYPDDPPYTPDAMFRLAELYYDESYIKYVDGLSAYNEALDRGTADSMESPVKEFERTIDLFRSLVRRYPDYRNVDGAYYLLGYCLNDTGHEEEARLAWLNLVCANKYTYDPAALAAEKAAAAASAGDTPRPAASLDTGVDDEGVIAPFVNPFTQCEPITENSRFFFESWWLIGNYHFDYDTSRYGVETAMAAYKKLIEDPDHRFYDKGLYKLAWSYFKADMYPEAIHKFAEVVEFSDKQAKSKGSGMRPEAIQYLAVCFFTDDWNVDMRPDSVSGIERLQDPQLMPQDRPWTQEVYARLGDIYFENEKHEDAIAVWELFLERWPIDVQVLSQVKVKDSGAAQTTRPSAPKQGALILNLKRHIKPVIAAAAVIMIGLALFLGTSPARAVDPDQIRRVVMGATNIHIRNFVPGRTEPMHQEWVSRSLSIYMSKIGQEFTLWDFRADPKMVVSSYGTAPEAVPVTEAAAGAARTRINSLLDIVPSGVPGDAKCVPDDASESDTQDCEVYRLTWTERSMRGEALFRRWRVFVEPGTNRPKRAQFYDKSPTDVEYVLRHELVVEYLSDDEMKTAIEQASL